MDVHTVKAMVRLSVASFDATDHATDFSFSVAANAATDFRAPQPPILSTMELCDLPLYAVQRLADGTWLVRSPLGDPLWPPVDVCSARKQAWTPRPARLEQQDATTGQIGA